MKNSTDGAMFVLLAANCLDGHDKTPSLSSSSLYIGLS